MTPAVRVVVVSHSAPLAAGVVELAAQMAPDVDLVAAGGGDDGGLGTSFDRIAAALADPPAGGVVVLYDLGSALLTTETAVEFLEPDAAALVEVVDAPLVEGALAAATTAQGGADRASVAAAARAAGAVPADGTGRADDGDAPGVRRRMTLVNPLGLHARPAAELARALGGLDARVRVDDADARSVLDVVRLARRGGDTVTVRASGPDAVPAVDALADLIAGGFGEADAPVPPVASTVRTPAGTSTSPAGGPAPGAAGRALGPLVHAAAIRVPDAAPVGDPHEERSRVDGALERASARLARGDAMAVLHATLLADPTLLARADEQLDAGREAAGAWWAAVGSVADDLAAETDELVAARAADVREAGAAVLAELGVAADPVPDDVAGAVLAVAELGPGEIATVAERGGAAVVLAGGSPTAHAVVVARGLGLPVVLRAGDLLDGVPEGTLVDVDGTAGTVVVDPPDAADRRARIAAETARREAEDADAGPVEIDGRPVLLAANVGSLAEARAAVRFGAEAVGLLRTELFVLDRPAFPDEDEQTADLAAVLDLLGERPVVVRVLDPGGDKPVRSLALDPRRNGFLGVRGLRWLLAHPDVLHTQLRAICRAAAGGNGHRAGHRVSVMAPMVSVAAEVRAFRAAIDAAVDSLRSDGTPHIAPEAVGVMVEVPGAAIAADEIAAEADFLSLGTNDLASYTMAADRTEPGVAELLDPHGTALWRLVEQVCVLAGDTPVAVCGELAAVPEFAARFARLGVGELSVAPAGLPRLRRALRDRTRGTATEGTPAARG